MIYKNKGDVFEYEGKVYIVGEEVYAVSSNYRGLLGTITEIRTGSDRETANEEPDIYCDFHPPILKQDREDIESMCGKMDKLCLDGIIMAPEMLVTTREQYDSYPTIKVYSLVEEFAEDDNYYRSERIFTSFEAAEFEMRRTLLVSKLNGCLARWEANEDYTERQEYEYRFEAGNCSTRLFIVYIEEYDMPLAKDFTEQMYNIGLIMEHRKDIAEQIECWEMSGQVRRNVVNDYRASGMIKKELEGKKLYIEEYAEAVAEVAHILVAEHKQAEKLLQIAKERGKL